MASLLNPADAILFDVPEKTVTIEDDIRWVIPPDQRDLYPPECTHFLIPAGSTGTVRAVGVLANADVVVLRFPTSGQFCMVEADTLELSVEERDAIRKFTSSVVHKADNDGGGVDEESSSSEEDSDGGDPDFEGEDPDSEGEKPTSRKRAAVAGGDGLKKPRPVGRQKPRKRYEFLKLDEENPLRVAFEEAEAKKKTEDAAEFQAAVEALKVHDLYKKAAYQKILAEVEDWVERGGAEATGAGWIRRLMSKGEDRLTPSVVRYRYKAIAPGPGAA